MNTLQLQKLYPEAFSALSEPYRNDDCLEFSVDEYDTLFAEPRPDQIGALGDWCAVYDPLDKEWIVI